MNNKIRLSVFIALTLGTGVSAWRYFLSPQSDKPANLAAEIPVVDQQVLTKLTAEGVSREETLKLLSDPRAEAYFQRQEDKRALDRYFNGGDGAPGDEEIWQLIESIESEGRVLAYEAMALKLAWLERNSANGAEFEQAAERLVENYRQKSWESVQEYDPYEDVPGFAEYKEMEAQIVREVQQMATFPNGMSRQEYLRKRLQKAREIAYSVNSDQ